VLNNGVLRGEKATRGEGENVLCERTQARVWNVTRCVMVTRGVRSEREATIGCGDRDNVSRKARRWSHEEPREMESVSSERSSAHQRHQRSQIGSLCNDVHTSIANQDHHL